MLHVRVRGGVISR